MRTESPIGGGPGSRGSKSPSDYVVVGRMNTSKSPMDVDAAALAITGLSRSSVVADRQRLHAVDERNRAGDAQLSTRVSHIKSAVMPESHSYVQKVLKRKIEHRLESAAPVAPPTFLPSSSFPLYVLASPTDAALNRDPATDAGKGAMLQAIESERGYFGSSVKRCRLSDGEAVTKSDDVGGRFIRTGQPCRSVEDFFPTMSYVDVAPHMRALKREDASPDAGSATTECRPTIAVVDDEFVRRRPSQYVDGFRRLDACSPLVVDRDAGVAPALLPVGAAANGRHKFYGSSRLDVLSSGSASAGDCNGVAAHLSSFAGSVSKNRVIRGADFGHIPQQQQQQQPSGCVASLSKEHLHHNDGRVRRLDDNENVKKRHDLSAYYSLGRQHASTLTTPPHVPAMNGRDALNKITPRRPESHVLYMAGKGDNSSKLYSSARLGCTTDENKKQRVVDSRTEKKIKSGEFGTLKSLKDFYSKLDNKASTPEKPAFRGRLGSITNCGSQPVYQLRKSDEVSSGYAAYTDSQMGDEVAIDLSVHSRRMVSNVEESHGDRASRYELLKLGRGGRRKSRSCCSSPGMVLDLAKRINGNSSNDQRLSALDQMPHTAVEKMADNSQRWLGVNASSLPSSPFAYLADQVKQEIIGSAGEYHWNDADKQAACVSKADSRLPLKKRRLMEVGSPSADATSSPPSPQAEVSSDFSEHKPSTVKVECVPEDRSRRESPTLISAIVHGDEDGDLPLHVAVAQGNVDLVERILDIMFRLEMSMDCYNRLRQTPLHVAVLTDQPAVVRRLLKGGASPNVVDRNGLTSVHYAAKLASAECLDCLLEHSASRVDIDATTYSGQTALHLAVLSNSVQAVKLLIEAGAKIDACDASNGRTPLVYAFEQNNMTVARILVANGASPMLPSHQTPVPIARHCRVDVSRLHEVCVAADVKG